MQIVNRLISELIFAEYNPRQISEHDFKALQASLREFGFVDPIIVNQFSENGTDRKDVIVGGHMRCRAAQELGITEVPCVYVSEPPDRERQLNIRLNRNNGAWDFDLLANNFEVSDLLDWGFDEDELAFDVPDDNEPIDEEALAETSTECPKCGFKW